VFVGFVEEITRRRRIQTNLHPFRIELVDYAEPPRFLLAKKGGRENLAKKN
jgi:hypothetical protein